MRNLYLTADQIGLASGGGIVTHHERAALAELGQPLVWMDRAVLDGQTGQDPWKWDEAACRRLPSDIQLAHLYAGTFTNAVDQLKLMGAKVAYTAAAHDVQVSREEHEALGWSFDYPHLTDPALWERYVGGYRAADLLIVPSTHSEKVMRQYGCTNKIEVIPHGVDLPAVVPPPPKRFTLGYLGAIGPDKGLRYLFQAWAKLNCKDATLLLGGRQSTSNIVTDLIYQTGAGNVERMGWVNRIEDFYNRCSVVVQPSASEGFGIEVLEGLAHGRPVLCSTGAGAVDVVPDNWRFAARSVDALVAAIVAARAYTEQAAGGIGYGPADWRALAEPYTWAKIRARYTRAWRELLNV